jgi:L-ascorbate metabolism protein UlaG (beta-lactamase superfamily)
MRITGKSGWMKKVFLYSAAVLVIIISSLGFTGKSNAVTQKLVDLNLDGIVDFTDYSLFAHDWLQNELRFDIAPVMGDGIVDWKDFAVLTENWLTEYGEIVYIQWLGHASVKIWTQKLVIYVDPVYLTESPGDANLVLVTHNHSDHYSLSDIARVSGPQTKFIAAASVVASYGSGQAILPDEIIETDGVRIIAVPAYNTNKPNHPKANNWVGFIIEIGSQRIYCAGDTDLTDEMKALENISVAFLPAGGMYTMNAAEAAEATGYIKPDLAIPYHWGRNVGTISDARQFAELAQCRVKIMEVGEIISSDSWLEDATLIAHWKLNETEGDIANDNIGGNNGTLYGEPVWQPENGRLAGALEFDGIDDYVSTDFVLNPADGSFSIFVWIKTEAAGRAIISQADGRNWLSINPSDGTLMTDLRTTGRSAKSLASQSVITDGQWHHIGFVWDGSYRYLYSDGLEVAEDSRISALGASDGSLYFGTGSTLAAENFYSGLIDDIRIFGGSIHP